MSSDKDFEEDEEYKGQPEEEEEEDDGEEEDEEDQPKKPSKKAKKPAPKESSSSSKKSGSKRKKNEDEEEDEEGGDDSHLKGKKNKEGNTYFKISPLARATVNVFKGKLMVDLRRFYEKDGQELPTQKGISLTMEEWNRLLQVTDALKLEIRRMEAK